MSVLNENFHYSSTQGPSGTGAPTGNSEMNTDNGPGSTNIRRYLVLLHDCLAIKFVPDYASKTNNNGFPNCPHSPLENFSNRYCSGHYDVIEATRAGDNLIEHGRNEGVKATAKIGSRSADNSFNSGRDNQNSSCNDGCGDYKGRRHDGKCNDFNSPSPSRKLQGNSSEIAEDKDDHQGSSFNRPQGNQMNCSHDIASLSKHQSVASTTLKPNDDNNDSEISKATSDQMSYHNCTINNSNRYDQSNKCGYDAITPNSKCCRCSNKSPTVTPWESQNGTVKCQNCQLPINQMKKQRHQQLQQANHCVCTSEDCYENFHHRTTGFPSKDDAMHTIDKTSMNQFARGKQFRNHNATQIKPDHSVQALVLYKEFREINLNCFWNTAVHEAFKKMEYKGSVVPSTIIVGSPIRKHLTILKTAWSRKMLKSPSGYTIEFLGEIEELIADPIAKSQFVPLSDSLCWTIHELTSTGQEAFVDDIFLSLASAFPGMTLPTKELIYQTLEKLTRERKIYQTAQGYFVVTPDTHRYIMSTDPFMMPLSRADHQLYANAAANFLRNAVLQQEASLGTQSVDDQQYSNDNRQKNINEVELPQRGEPDRGRDENCPSPDSDTYSLPYGTFRRGNSLRLKKNVSGTTGCLPRRTLSMRLPKSKKRSGNVASHPAVGGTYGTDQVVKRTDVTGSFQNLEASQCSTVNEQLLSRRRKHKSFLSRLLSFRGVRKSGRKDRSGRSCSNAANKGQLIAPNDKSSKELISSKNDTTRDKRDEITTQPASAGKSSDVEQQPLTQTKVTSSSTQTSLSVENINSDFKLLSLATTSRTSTLERDDSDSGRCTDSHSDADAEITAALNRGLTPTIMHDHHRHHHFHPHLQQESRGRTVGRSHSSCNVYEKIESDLGLKVDVDVCDGRSPRSPSSQMSVSPSPSTFTTASAIYNSRGSNNRHNLYSRCHSSASSSGYSYRDFYNLYRRRYPSYQLSTPTSLESPSDSNEGVRFRPQQPIRYPPRSFERKQIFDEISRGQSKEKKSKNKAVTITCHNAGDAEDNGKLHRPHQHRSSESVFASSNLDNDNSSEKKENRRPPLNTPETNRRSKNMTSCINQGPMTTTFSQTVRNTTNLELEFRLPLSNIFKAALTNGHVQTSNNTSSGKFSPESFSTSSMNDSRGAENGGVLNEVSTTVSDLFTIKSFVKTNPVNDELSSTIEFKTNGDSHCTNVSARSNNTDKDNNSKVSYVIEAVSTKPSVDIHTKFNRESEI